VSSGRARLRHLRRPSGAAVNVSAVALAKEDASENPTSDLRPSLSRASRSGRTPTSKRYDAHGSETRSQRGKAPEFNTLPIWQHNTMKAWRVTAWHPISLECMKNGADPFDGRIAKCEDRPYPRNEATTPRVHPAPESPRPEGPQPFEASNAGGVAGW